MLLVLAKIKAWIVANPPRVFLIFSLTFGLLFVFLIPPLQTPDETTHFLRAYEISQGDVFSKTNNKVTGALLPKSISTTVNYLEKNNPVEFSPDVKYNIHTIKPALKIPLDSTKKSFYDISGASSYTPVGYIPQVIGIFIGRIFNASPLVLLYIARVFILIAWSILGFLSISVIPFKKWGLLGILLFPMFVAQSVSIGVDAISIGASVLFIAMILSYLNLKTISLNHMIKLLIVGLVMILSKQNTIVLLPLIFLLQKRQFLSLLKGRIWKWGSIVLPVLVLLIWTKLVGKVSANATQVANHQDSAGQIHFLLHHPLHTFKVLFDTYFFGWGDKSIESVIGVFGWMDTPLSELFVVSGFIVLAIVLFTDYEMLHGSLTKRVRFVFLIVSIVYALAVCALLYIIYSPVGYNIVIGVQGRYMLPILITLIPVFAGFATTTRSRYIRTVLICVPVLLVISMLTIYFRYYVTYVY